VLFRSGAKQRKEYTGHAWGDAWVCAVGRDDQWLYPRRIKKGEDFKEITMVCNAQGLYDM
jgi:hypothetical protein